MKFKFSTLVAGALAGLLCIATGCARVDELDNRVTDLEKKLTDVTEKQLPSVQDQITALTDFKTQIETKLTELTGKIENVDSKYAGLAETLQGQIEEALAGLQSQIDDLKNAEKGVSAADFEAYKTQMANTINALQKTLNTVGGNTNLLIRILQELYLIEVSEDGNVTLIYPVVYDETDPAFFQIWENQEAIGILGEYYTELAAVVAGLETKFNDYLTVAAYNEFKSSTLARIEALETFVTKSHADSAMFAQSLEALATKVKNDSTLFANKIIDLETADQELLDSINSVITNQIEPLQQEVAGIKTLIGTLPEDVTNITAWLEKHETAIGELNTAIEKLTARVDGIEDILAHRIQSLVFVPEYKDGMFTVNTANLVDKTEDATVKIPLVGKGGIKSVNSYRVKPADLADSLVKAFAAEQITATLEAVPVKTRRAAETELVQLTVRDIKLADADKGIISVVSSVEDSISTDDIESNAVALVLTSENNSRSTEYTLCKGTYAKVLFDGRDAASDTTVTPVPYNKADKKDFFNPANDKFQPMFKFGETLYTPATLKEKLTIDVAPFIVYDLDESVPNKFEGEKDLFTVVANKVADADSVFYTVNLSNDRSKNVHAVGDTVKMWKYWGIKKENVDTVYAAPYVGYFVVTPLQLKADLSATVTWEFDDDVVGDRAKLNIDGGWGADGRNPQYAYRHDSVAVKIDAEDMTKESAYTLDSLSHKTPAKLKVTKVVGGQTVAVAAAEGFTCAPYMQKVDGKFAKIGLDSLVGFNFDASKYIVETKYALGYKEPHDTLTATLTIALTDRSRKVISHDFAAVTLKVTPNFGGELHYVLHGDVKNQYDGVYDYFADAIKRYPEGSTTKANFDKFWNLTGVNHPTVLGNISAIANQKDSIIVTVPYDVENIGTTYKTEFEIKDTVTTAYGQKIALKFPVKLEWPKYDFKHVSQFVGKDTCYYSMVKPNYQGVSGYDISRLKEFDVFAVDMKQNFVVDSCGTVITEDALAAHKLTVKRGLIQAYEGITMNDADLITYKGKADYVGVRDTLLMNVGETKIALPTKFDEGKDYYNYQVRGYKPFQPIVWNDVIEPVNEVKEYEVEILKKCVLKDNRKAASSEAMDWDLLKDGNWVVGNNSNGFANGTSANNAYSITGSITVDTSKIPATLSTKITYDESTQTIKFDYTGQEFLLEPIVIPCKVKIETLWQSFEGQVTVTFAPKN